MLRQISVTFSGFEMRTTIDGRPISFVERVYAYR